MLQCEVILQALYKSAFSECRWNARFLMEVLRDALARRADQHGDFAPTVTAIVAQQPFQTAVIRRQFRAVAMNQLNECLARCILHV